MFVAPAMLPRRQETSTRSGERAMAVAASDGRPVAAAFRQQFLTAKHE
jgi:hypothetical protein